MITATEARSQTDSITKASLIEIETLIQAAIAKGESRFCIYKPIPQCDLDKLKSIGYKVYKHPSVRYNFDIEPYYTISW